MPELLYHLAWRKPSRSHWTDACCSVWDIWGLLLSPLGVCVLLFPAKNNVGSKKVFVLWWNEEISSYCWRVFHPWRVGDSYLHVTKPVSVQGLCCRGAQCFLEMYFFCLMIRCDLQVRCQVTFLADILWTGDCEKWHVGHSSCHSVSCVASAFWKILGPFWW